jgi:hypothetical protein
MATCKNCGRAHALHNATEVDVALNGAPTVLRCKLCDSTAGPERRAHVDRDRVELSDPSEPLSIEEARARTALLEQEMTRLM